MMDEPWKLMGSEPLPWKTPRLVRGWSAHVAYTDLRDWIRQLDKAGELKRIPEAVSPRLEMAEIADRAAKLGKGWAKAGGSACGPGGPALLFENVTGFPGA